MPSHQQMTLLVFGATTYLGREVARFGRSMGHRILAYTDDLGPPELDEPWMHGVQWMTQSRSSFSTLPNGPPAAFIYCDTLLFDGRRPMKEVLFDRPTRLIEQATELSPPPRFVLRSSVAQPLLPSSFITQIRKTEEILLISELSGAILRFPTLYGPERPDSVAAKFITSAIARLPLISGSAERPSSMRIETAALAMLRAALEPSFEGVLQPREIAHIGDVMIPQH